MPRANPGKLNYVSSGTGSLFHLIGELFKQQAGVDMVHVPQTALTPAVQDLVGGHVDLGFLSINAIRPHGGKSGEMLATEIRRDSAIAEKTIKAARINVE